MEILKPVESDQQGLDDLQVETTTLPAPLFTDGIMTCPKCGSQQFWIAFRELVNYRLSALDKSDGWGENEHLESDELENISCYDCDTDIQVTPEAEKFIRNIE